MGKLNIQEVLSYKERTLATYANSRGEAYEIVFVATYASKRGPAEYALLHVERAGVSVPRTHPIWEEVRKHLGKR